MIVVELEAGRAKDAYKVRAYDDGGVEVSLRARVESPE